MRSKIKELIPKPIKNLLRPLKQKLVDNPRKRLLFLQMRKKHEQFIQQIKGKEKIKVVFLAIHKSVWKVDPVFKKMLDNPFFEPLILVCPYTIYGEERMKEDMKDTYEYFEDKGYPLLSSYNKDENIWLSLEEIKPDIVFFTNPHKLTRKEYYEDAYMNYLSCYVPYYTDIASNSDLESSYNQKFHNAVWKIFLESSYSYNRAVKTSTNKGRNLILSGNLMQEMFYEVMKKNIRNLWKEQKSIKKKIIYAPHQSIELENNLHLSTFLKNGEIIKDLAIKYSDKVQWSFKPHPLLKSKLYLHSEWGIEKTNTYYDFWKNNSYTQLEDGEYIELFSTSDAIIHDSGSFIYEYLLVEKPCGYLYFNGVNQLKAINSYGKELLKEYNILSTDKDIEYFIDGIIKDNIKGNKFTTMEVNPSSVILNQLKEAVSNG